MCVRARARVLLSAADCPQVNGYLLTAGADHSGDDITCDAISGTDAASRCGKSRDCKSFNTFLTQGGTPMACLKRVAGPLITNAAVCFYTRVANRGESSKDR